MSFAGDVKNELVRVEEEASCCEQAELSALLWMGGVISFGGKGRIGIKFVTENAAVARKTLRSLKKEGIDDTEVKVTRALRLKNGALAEKPWRIICTGCASFQSLSSPAWFRPSPPHSRA